MIIMLAVYNVLSYGIAWYATWQDDMHYGRPRTAQYDVIVGHNDSAANPTHIIAVNLNRTIVIIELQGETAARRVSTKASPCLGKVRSYPPSP